MGCRMGRPHITSLAPAVMIRASLLPPCPCGCRCTNSTGCSRASSGFAGLLSAFLFSISVILLGCLRLPFFLFFLLWV